VTGGRASESLLDSASGLWSRIVVHPFVIAVADGTLDKEAFDRWLVEDHAFVAGFRRFLAGLVSLAPDEATREVLVGALVPLDAELQLFDEEASRRGLDLAVEPGPTTLGYTSFVRASLQEGYDVALTVLYGAEKAYFDAWSSVRERARETSEYWLFIDNWSSDAFGAWVRQIASMLDALSSDPTAAMRIAFDRVVRFELRFWDAVHRGESW
jgi:thiaminase/transcriptional activator TenA